jgi:hypothetical protein
MRNTFAPQIPLKKPEIYKHVAIAHFTGGEQQNLILA